MVAEDQGQRSYPMAAAAVLTLQDAVEGMLVLIAEVSGAPLPKNPNFESYWQPIADKVGSDILFHRTAMGRLNRARVNLKHHGILPHSSELEGFLVSARNFLADAAVLAFEGNFESDTLVDLLPAGPVADHLRAAETAMSSGDQRAALENAAIAFDELRRATQPRDARGRTIRRYRPTYDSAHNLGLSKAVGSRFARAWDELLNEVAQLTEVSDLATRGIDHSKYLRFRHATPMVAYYVNGDRRCHWGQAQSANAKEARYCIDFVLDAAVRLLEESREENEPTVDAPDDHDPADSGRKEAVGEK